MTIDFTSPELAREGADSYSVLRGPFDQWLAEKAEEAGAEAIYGIPVEELPYVKQKFYKGSSKARGSGIGLAVCDEIMRLHNGTFDIANASGGGAVVTMTLPMEK